MFNVYKNNKCGNLVLKNTCTQYLVYEYHSANPYSVYMFMLTYIYLSLKYTNISKFFVMLLTLHVNPNRQQRSKPS